MKRITFFILVASLTLLFTKCSKDNNPTENTKPNDTTDPNTISVALSSIPSSAEIIINGSPSDKVTPYTFSNLTSGNYEFKIRKMDYDSIVHSYFLAKGDHKQISDTLKPIWSGYFLGDKSASYYNTQGGDEVYANSYIFSNTLTIPQNLTAKVTVTYSYNDQSGSTADGGQIWFGDLNTSGVNYYDIWGTGGSKFIGFLPEENKTITFVVDKSKYPSGSKAKLCFGVVNGKRYSGSFSVIIHEAILSVE